MKQFRTIAVLIVMIFFGLSLFPQSRGSGRLGKNRAPNIQKRNFSIEKTRLIEGKIVEVATGDNCLYGSPGVHLIVNDGKENLIVHMGPEYFFKSKGIGFKKGVSVKINTFEGTFNEKVAFFASSIVTAEKKIIVRDKYGDPEWRRGKSFGSGKGRGRRPNRRNYYR